MERYEQELFSSVLTNPPYETWYAQCAEKFGTATLARKRRMLFRAAMFAGHSANNHVRDCEYDYSAWVVSNYPNPDAWTPKFCGNRWARLYDSAWQYILDIDEDWFMRDKWALVYDLARNVKYLGAVKASFALALCGYDIACIDTHALQMAGFSFTEANDFYRITNPKKRSDAIDTYRAYHDAIFPDNARREQWAFFARDEPTFSASGHKAYFLSQGVHCDAPTC